MIDLGRKLRDLFKFRIFASKIKKNRGGRSSQKEQKVQQVVMSGGLLQVFGIGVMIIGDSGIGKSESALELISRGYRFVSDDVTRITKTSLNKLIGEAPDLSKYFMEIRGLSIINIREIFGTKAIAEKSEIDLIINLKKWEHGKKYDRLGLETQDKYEILGINVPQISIPVAPGRNISTLIEVACKVHTLREKGYHAPQEIALRLDRALELNSNLKRGDQDG